VVVLGVVGAALSGAIRRRYEGMTGAKGMPVELCPTASKSQAGESEEFRKQTWRATFYMGLKRPILGWGAGSFPTAYAPHAIADFTRHAHSTYFQLFAELGFPGALAWIGLLACAVVPLLKAPREWYWAPGVGAALGASAVHGVFDSLYYVPAIALTTSVLIGIALRPSGELAARMDAGAQPAPRSGRGARPPGAGPIRRLPRTALLGIAGSGLLLCVVLAWGRTLLAEGVGLRQDRQYAEAASRLATAQILLPWDHEVADAQRETFLYLGKIEEAVTAAQRAINLAPERPPAYYFLGRIREDGQNNLPLAQLQYEQGLQHAPNEVRLLTARARLLERMGDRKTALETYRRIADVEDSPVGRIRALSEIRDYRYARARMALAQDAAARGNRKEADEQWQRAACLLAERRILFQAEPTGYRATGDFELTTERELRAQEAQLWTTLAEDFGRRGDKRLAGLAEEQAAHARESADRLQAIFDQFQ
jgi:tetratricopeptide (TPR) repeat protein